MKHKKRDSIKDLLIDPKLVNTKLFNKYKSKVMKKTNNLLQMDRYSKLDPKNIRFNTELQKKYKLAKHLKITSPKNKEKPQRYQSHTN